MSPKALSVSSACLIFAAALHAQLVSNPQGIPHTTGNPPVIFLNGFQLNCASASFQNDFGIADQVLQSISRASLFFNTCSFPSSTSIEALGNAFGSFLAGLTYDDGTPVTTVDVIGYSMGGLIVRSYLSGKQVQGNFTPPATIPIRKAIFIATPNFGSPAGALAFGSSFQADEFSSGSHFLMDLNTWNQNHDDLRGIDAIAIAGNAGTGLTVSPGFDDGLVALSSASLRFFKAGVTRVLPLCHTAGGIPNQTGLCPANAKGVARILSATDDNARIVTSFLAGTTEWQNIGTDIDQTHLLKNGSGIVVRARTANDQTITPASITAGKRLNMSNSEIGWTDLTGGGPVNIAVSAGAQSFNETVNVVTGGAQAIVVKPGPSIDAIVPAAALVFPRVVAPRMIISLYGTALDQASLTVNNEPLTILYNSSGQINAVLPADLPTGLTRLQLQNAAGSQSISLYAETAYPVVFTLGNNAAAAVDAGTGTIVTASEPLRGGDYLELYLTGLGATSNTNGFDNAIAKPIVTIAGVSCPVTYAGAAPGFEGLDQINCRVPLGLAPQIAASVVVTSGIRSSPITTVAVRAGS